MEIIKKKNWKNSGRSVRNYTDKNNTNSEFHPELSESVTEQPEQPAVSTCEPDIAAQREKERQAFETELIELKKETLDSAYAAGFEKGHTDGHAAGSKKALDQYQADSEALLSAINTLSKEKTTLVTQAQADLVSLASQIARRLLSCELTLNPDIIVHIVSEALRKITDKSTVIIRVHPDDLPTLQSNQSILNQLVPDIQSLQLDSDPAIEPGGCMIETSLGYVDATIATKLASIELAIRGVSGPAESEPL